MSAAKTVTYRFETIGNIDCLVVVANDGHETAIPLGAFHKMSAEALSRTSPDAHPTAVRLIPAHSFQVAPIATETGDVIALLVNKGTGHDIGLSVRLEDAPALGQALLDQAALASPKKPSQN